MEGGTGKAEKKSLGGWDDAGTQTFCGKAGKLDFICWYLIFCLIIVGGEERNMWWYVIQISRMVDIDKWKKGGSLLYCIVLYCTVL